MSDIFSGYLPDRIMSKEPFLSWLNGERAVFGTFNTNRADMLAQANIDTATWGLSLWEQAFGVPTDLSKNIDYRRSIVRAKIRGTGTVTVAMIKNVAASFSHGDVTITENPATYSFTITFVGTLGIPPNMADLTAAIEEIKPAHLAYTYVYIYNTHAVLSAFTHAQLAAYTHEQLRNEVVS